MRISDWSSDVCSSDLLQASLVHAEYEFRERSCKTQGRQIAVHPRPRRRSHEDPAMTTSAATESRVEIDGKIFNPYSKDFIRSPSETWKRLVADYPVAWHKDLNMSVVSSHDALLAMLTDRKSVVQGKRVDVSEE